MSNTFKQHLATIESKLSDMKVLDNKEMNEARAIVDQRVGNREVSDTEMSAIKSSAYKGKGNHVYDFVQGYVIAKSWLNSTGTCQPTTIYFTDNAFDIVKRSLKSFKDWELLNSYSYNSDGECVAVRIDLNEDRVSNDMRQAVSEAFKVTIPEKENNKRYQEIDNSILDAISCTEELEYLKAGIMA